MIKPTTPPSGGKVNGFARVRRGARREELGTRLSPPYAKFAAVGNHLKIAISQYDPPTTKRCIRKRAVAVLTLRHRQPQLMDELGMKGGNTQNKAEDNDRSRDSHAGCGSAKQPIGCSGQSRFFQWFQLHHTSIFRLFYYFEASGVSRTLTLRFQNSHRVLLSTDFGTNYNPAVSVAAV